MRRWSRVVGATLATTVLVAGFGIASGAAGRLQSKTAEHGSMKVTETYYPDRLVFPSLHDLTKWSDVVVRVEVVKEQASYRLPLDPPVANNASQPPLSSVGALKQAHASPPVAAQGTTVDQGPLKTDFLTQVVDVIKGPAVTPGQLLTVTASGGRTAPAVGVEAGNPLPQVGHEEIMFLHKNALEPGTYVPTGGPQGRYEVVNGTVYAVDSEGPVARANNQKSKRDFAAAIQAAMK